MLSAKNECNVINLYENTNLFLENFVSFDMYYYFRIYAVRRSSL